MERKVKPRRTWAWQERTLDPTGQYIHSGALNTRVFCFVEMVGWTDKLDWLTSTCFAFGIGQFAGTALITGMAREGRGFAQFITSDDRLQLKVRLGVALCAYTVSRI